MPKTSLINIAILTLVSLTAFGQKVKYKEIYSLLSAKQYDQAEPFLRNYLKDNSDNPNANLFMGIIFHEKSLNDDVLIDTEQAIQRMDSAVLYYDKALKGITEKEIKKNKEYYSAYNRRDFRTGEFGVKASDVQLAIEENMNYLRERIDKVKMLKHYFVKADRMYKRSQELFGGISKAYPGERELYLRADEAAIHKLKELTLQFDSCAKMFEYYRSTLTTLGNTKYNQAWSLKDISNFKVDGLTTANFYEDDLKVWDYKKFANMALNVIEKEVSPTRENLVKYDIEINKLRQRLETDSVSVKSDLTKLIEKLLDNQLKKFDPDPMPMSLFAMKINELEYLSTVIENKAVHVGEDFTAKLTAVSHELSYLNRLDSISDKLLTRNLDEDILNYQQFVTATYSKGSILKSYIRSMKENAERELGKKKQEFNFIDASLKWLVVGNDSIPLVAQPGHKKFKPLVVNSSFTAGLSYKDSTNAQGYFYSVTPSRKPDVKVLFDVDKPNFTLGKLRFIKALLNVDPGGQIFFVATFSEKNVKGKYPVTITKIYRSDGLSWSKNIVLDFIPQELIFVSGTGDLLIKSGETSATIDKTGKLIGG
jgi:hypothetical protein